MHILLDLVVVLLLLLHRMTRWRSGPRGREFDALCDPLKTRAMSERLCDGVGPQKGAILSVIYLYLLPLQSTATSYSTV